MPITWQPSALAIWPAMMPVQPAAAETTNVSPGLAAPVSTTPT